MVYAIFAISLIVALGAIYASAVAWIYFRQERLLFEPDPLAADQRLCADEDVCEHFIDVPGARLSVAQLSLPSPRGVVFYLHGNSGNLQKWMAGLESFREMNFDVVMFDYRGFGKSSGAIASEAQLQADVRAVWAHFAPQYEGKRIVIAGQSLGTGLASSLSADLCAAGRAPDLTMMVSPYSSMRALADELYPWVPSMVLRYPLMSVDCAGRMKGAVMLIHAEKDTLIGLHHSEALRRAAPHAQFHCVAGAGHGDVHQFPAFRAAVTSALGCL